MKVVFILPQYFFLCFYKLWHMFCASLLNSFLVLII
nr:MAG TPA: hypothetical protein [Caudoviricetes sp.]